MASASYRFFFQLWVAADLYICSSRYCTRRSSSFRSPTSTTTSTPPMRICGFRISGMESKSTPGLLLDWERTGNDEANCCRLSLRDGCLRIVSDDRKERAGDGGS